MVVLVMIELSTTIPTVQVLILCTTSLKVAPLTIIVDISDVQTASALVSGVTIAVINDGSAAAAAAGTMTVVEAWATTISGAANDLIVVVVGAISLPLLPETAFEASGNRVLTINNTASDVGDTIMTLYSDGTDVIFQLL